MVNNEIVKLKICSLSFDISDINFKIDKKLKSSNFNYDDLKKYEKRKKELEKELAFYKKIYKFTNENSKRKNKKNKRY